ncbi:MAG: hypothetical protein NT069_32395 [Planctomycetota bacterium]|nr:hypothetical protein [Planctomycetota bacterium]
MESQSKPADGDASQLGELLQPLHPGRANFYAGVILVVILELLALGIAWGCYHNSAKYGWRRMPLYHANNWNWVAASFVMLVGFVFAWLGWVIYIRIRGLVGFHVDLHQEGLYVHRREGDATFLWTRIASVRESILVENLPILSGPLQKLGPAVKSRSFLVRRDDGVCFGFTHDDLRHSDWLGEQLRSLCDDYGFEWTVVESRH